MSTQHRASPESAALGKKIRDTRNKLGWSLQQMEENSGLDAAVIGSYERGDRSIPLSALPVLARALGAHAEVIFTMNPRPPCRNCGGSPPEGFTCNDCPASTPKPTGPSHAEHAERALNQTPTGGH